LWGDALVVDAIRVQMNGIYALPVARAAFPSKRIALPDALVERGSSIQDVLIKIRMALRRRCHIRVLGSQ
jgi:hypothetical protein